MVELCRALQHKLPNHAYFCGITAAAIMGVPLPSRHERSTVVHVAVPPSHRAVSGRNIRGHTFCTTAEEVREWHGLRISTPERTWCQLGMPLTVAELVAAGDFLIHWRLPHTNEVALREAIDTSSNRRGIRSLQTAVELLDDRSESPRESHLRVIFVTGGLTGLAVNLPITTSGGFRYRADLAFPDQRVIVEYQSDFHRDPARYRADMTRISRLEADDWYVILVNSDDLGNPAELLRRVRLVLSRR